MFESYSDIQVAVAGLACMRWTCGKKEIESSENDVCEADENGEDVGGGMNSKKTTSRR